MLAGLSLAATAAEAATEAADVAPLPPVPLPPVDCAGRTDVIRVKATSNDLGPICFAIPDDFGEYAVDVPGAYLLSGDNAHPITVTLVNEEDQRSVGPVEINLNGWTDVGRASKTTAASTALRIITAASAGAHRDITAKGAAVTAAGAWLGAPVGKLHRALPDTPEPADRTGWVQGYQHGAIYWTAKTGAHAVYGDIHARYLALGGPNGALGYPTTDETASTDGAGRVNRFAGTPARGGAALYWTQANGVRLLDGAVLDKWAAFGGERGWLGRPTGDTAGTPDGIGRYNHFTGGPSIYWTAETGAHEIGGAIRDKWAALDWERSPLGYPATDETAAPGGGRYNDFTGNPARGSAPGGSVYWHPATGAHALYGPVWKKWAEHGRTAWFGYPLTDQTAVAGGPHGAGQYVHFGAPTPANLADLNGPANASIYYSAQTWQAHTVQGMIRQAWRGQGWENGLLGYPTSDEQRPNPGLWRSDFQHGTITYDASGTHIH